MQFINVLLSMDIKRLKFRLCGPTFLTFRFLDVD